MGLPPISIHPAARDEAYYLSVAQEGYQPAEGACAFYPLWPAVVRFFNPLGHAGQTIVALALTQILSLGALILYGFWYFVGILASLQVCFALRHISFSWGG